MMTTEAREYKEVSRDLWRASGRTVGAE
jgi:hypothetical protein